MLTGNEPINPQSIHVDQHGNVYIAENYSASTGITIRQHFAALALQGLLSNRGLFEALSTFGRNNDADKFYAEVAVEHAEALIDELNKRQK